MSLSFLGQLNLVIGSHHTYMLKVDLTLRKFNMGNPGVVNRYLIG